jgi:glycosyltransferase involved in cell wall biosynthesis
MFFSGVYLLAEKPWGLAVADNSLSVASQQVRAIGCRPHFLVFRTWYGGDLRGGLAALRILARSRFPKVTWMCNAPTEVRMLRALGQRALFCHHNLFCNERVFNIRLSPIEYDAIYIARLDPYKRLWLAKDIPRLRIVTANPNDSVRLRAWGCSHAVINMQFMEYESIASEIGKAGCGLALSEKEGGMLAATEYLLCGKPVITTPSLGGREYWLDAKNSVTVSPDASAIADTVKKILSSPWDPFAIREGAISRLRIQRRILFEYLSQGTSRLRCDSEDQMDADWLYRQFVLQKDIRNALKRSHFDNGLTDPDQRNPTTEAVDSR